MAAAEARATDEEIPSGTLVAGKYRVHRVIGRGGMGRVLAATNEATGKNVALKWILDARSSDAATRFEREARAAGRIHHPNVVDVYDVVEHEGATCIVMELLRGETLQKAIARERRFPITRALELGIEIGRGIAAAHAAGVIHRDLKPGNVFLCDDEGAASVKILDFGISKLREPEPTEITDTGVVLGTPQYLAPEQVRSASDVDERADVYALGAVLYEMLSGRPPHQNPHVPALLVEIATVAPRPVELDRPEISASLARVVARAIAKDRDARIPTAQAFVSALRTELQLPETPRGIDHALEADTIDPARAPTAATAVETPHRRGRLDARWIVLAVIAVVGAIALYAQSRPPASTVAPTSVIPSASPPPATAIERTAPPITEAPAATPVIVEPRPRTTGRRAPPSSVAVPEIVAPRPATEAAPPPSTPEPRAGRLGLDDL